MNKQLMVKVIDEYIEFKLLCGMDRLTIEETILLFNKYKQHKKKKDD